MGKRGFMTHYMTDDTGKSTLLRRILTERHGYRIAVIMNEFGDTADIEGQNLCLSCRSE
ncbi:hypothetical protein JB92DRAFT_3013418 [Gautieria morchelliformis]|nr:hypothetical protein JB92DRAFT_3013418 [Gautieria morchelliformis]